MATSRRMRKGKVPMSNIDAPSLPSNETQCIAHICFGLAGMEEYYISFKEKKSIHVETKFEDVEKHPKTQRPSKYDAMPTVCVARMWLDLVCAQLIPSQNTTEVPIEVVVLIACIIDHTHINVGEIIVDQFKRKAKKQATPLLYPILFKIAQMDQAHKSQIVKLAKVIPSMIQQAIKKAIQPARDKLKGICATVEVLESHVIALRKDVPTLTRPPPASNSIPPELAAVAS
ncbi:hypothetical protein HAX54_027679 [Datura stramonium]|uniref:Putative plant transposon protein domain-containing protein n=1 Tax=Datura stramonium TaxID=4076 RepID=A0ABS8V4X7_DATST|nr:hypothetical protein [Datura stramonium]